VFLGTPWDQRGVTTAERDLAELLRWERGEQSETLGKRQRKEREREQE